MCFKFEKETTTAAAKAIKATADNGFVNLEQKPNFNPIAGDDHAESEELIVSIAADKPGGILCVSMERKASRQLSRKLSNAET